MSSIGASLRLLRAGWVILREGVVASIPTENLSGSARQAQKIASLFAKRRSGANRQERLARAIHRLGPSYVKLGQFLQGRRGGGRRCGRALGGDSQR